MTLPTPEQIAITIIDKFALSKFDKEYLMPLLPHLKELVLIDRKAIAKELRSAMRISKATYVITRPDRILELLERLEDGESLVKAELLEETILEALKS